MFAQVLFWVIPLLFLSRREQCFRMVALQQQLEVCQPRSSTAARVLHRVRA